MEENNVLIENVNENEMNENINENKPMKNIKEQGKEAKKVRNVLKPVQNVEDLSNAKVNKTEKPVVKRKGNRHSQRFNIVKGPKRGTDEIEIIPLDDNALLKQQQEESIEVNDQISQKIAIFETTPAMDEENKNNEIVNTMETENVNKEVPNVEMENVENVQEQPKEAEVEVENEIVEEQTEVTIKITSAEDSNEITEALLNNENTENESKEEIVNSEVDSNSYEICQENAFIVDNEENNTNLNMVGENILDSSSNTDNANEEQQNPSEEVIEEKQDNEENGLDESPVEATTEPADTNAENSENKEVEKETKHTQKFFNSKLQRIKNFYHWKEQEKKDEEESTEKGRGFFSLFSPRTRLRLAKKEQEQKKEEQEPEQEPEPEQEQEPELEQEPEQVQEPELEQVQEQQEQTQEQEPEQVPEQKLEEEEEKEQVEEQVEEEQKENQEQEKEEILDTPSKGYKTLIDVVMEENSDSIDEISPVNTSINLFESIVNSSKTEEMNTPSKKSSKSESVNVTPLSESKKRKRNNEEEDEEENLRPKKQGPRIRRIKQALNIHEGNTPVKRIVRGTYNLVKTQLFSPRKLTVRIPPVFFTKFKSSGDISEDVWSGSTRNKLLMIIGNKNMKVYEVPLTWKSLCSHASYVLDFGGEAFIQFIGSKCSPAERLYSASICGKLKKREYAGRGNICHYEEEEALSGKSITLDLFWEALGMADTSFELKKKRIEKNNKRFEEIINEDRTNNNLESLIRVYRVNCESESLDLIHEGSLPNHKVLSTDSVIILDAVSEVYLWKGRRSTLEARSLGVRLAKELYMKHPLYPRPSWSILEKTGESLESVLFCEKFSDRYVWKDPEDQLIFS